MLSQFISKLSFMFIILTLSSSLFASSRLSNIDELDRIIPSLNGINTQEGYSILWLDGHPQFFTQLAPSLFTIPASDDPNLYLVGSKIIFNSQGIDQNHFQAQRSFIKDLYSTRILRQFKTDLESSFSLSFDNTGFIAKVGNATEFRTTKEINNQLAHWMIKDIYGTIIKRLTTSISYKVIGFYAPANLQVAGSLKLNLNNKPIRTGKLIFIRKGPGMRPLKREYDLNLHGRFDLQNLAPGEYQIYYSRNGHNTPIKHHFQLTSNVDHLQLVLRYQTNYSITVKLNKKGKNIDVQTTHQWKRFTIALPLGLDPDDQQNELETIPHFLGDFNSPVKLDLDGNPLSLPYADENLDQLVFLSWAPTADDNTITGTIATNICQFDPHKRNKLHFASTLKPTAYGPWRLEEKKIYANLSLAFQCGPNHAQEITSIPLPQTPIGNCNELGELQAEIPAKILRKITSGKNFSLKWKFTDANDQSEITIKLKAKSVK